jgi:hypothetical protein
MGNPKNLLAIVFDIYHVKTTQSDDYVHNRSHV